MVVDKKDNFYIVLSTDDNIYDTIKKNIKTAVKVNITDDEYESTKQDLAKLNELIRDKIKEGNS